MKTSTQKFWSSVCTLADGTERHRLYKQTIAAMAAQTGSDIRDWYSTFGANTIADLNDIAVCLYNTLSPNAKDAEGKFAIDNA